MKKYAVIVAGGSGTRMGTEIPKQFLLLNNKPVLWYSLQAFLTAFDDIQIVLVLPANHIEQGTQIIASTKAAERIKITAGGSTRYDSVQNGLKHVTEKSVVFVHDGVRCLVTKDLIQRCYTQAIDKGNAIPAIAVTDSLRTITTEGNDVIDRSKVRSIQTPQTFLSDILLPAFNQPWEVAFTDEASVVEKNGTVIHLIEGAIDNIKITTPLDLLIAERILLEREKSDR
ncbi:MAG: 2-C-methyl-D-erythritol 4-phosphate cytidylyltransferase [Chitinophagaceae bacterium]